MKPINDAHLYGREYFTQHYESDPKRERAYHQEARRIIGKVPHGGNILDIGCGTGGFLQCFDSRWDKFGIEPSGFATVRAIEKGVTIITELDEYLDGFFSVVVFRGTIQHINNPIETIANAYKALRPGGLIAFLATPNTGGIVYRLWQELPPLDPPRNWCLFSDKTLTNVLTRIGFENVTVNYPYKGSPYANPKQDFARFVMRFFGIKKPFAFPGNMMEVYAWKPL